MNATDAATEKNLEIIRSYLAAVERLEDAESVVRFWHPEGVFEELPNAISPRGSSRDRAAIASSYDRGRALLASQRYEVVNAFGAGDQMLVEMVWTGTLKIDAGPLRAGESLRARCAAVFELRGGLIYRQRQYDCYDPRGA
jgi:ketosteroid isomerase-like protein